MAGAARLAMLACAPAALACAATLLACAPAAFGVASGPVVRLSNLRTLTRWAYPTREAPVRLSPSPRSRSIGALRFLTSEDQGELYVALAQTEPSPGAAWVQIELPGRPNGRRGWVARSALGTFHTVDGYLLVDRRQMRVTLYRAGRVVFSAPAAIGAPATPTPAGDFYAMEKLRPVNAPAYGPFAIGTSAYAPTLSEWPGGGVVGIHGTNEPQLVPSRASHGCVRLRNGDIARLWPMVALGTPILIT